MSTTPNNLIDVLKELISESQNPDTLDIDQQNSLGIVRLINHQDHQVTQAIETQLAVIAQAVDAIVASIKQGGRLIYIGAGTSGRMGVLDAVECVPTFGVDDQLVMAIMAGGEVAMFRAQEGIEDDPEAAVADLKHAKLCAKDILVGIAASGRTPYVIGALAYAKSLDTKTIALSCNPDAAIADMADISILPVVGPEALTGSTRMKAGTAQKLVLNMLSTATMIRLGKSYANLMVDLNATNEKLLARGIRMIMELTAITSDEAEQVLKAADYRVKTAIFMILADCNKTKAEQALNKANGFLRTALESYKQSS